MRLSRPSLLVAAAAATLVLTVPELVGAQSRSDAPSTLVITYRDGRRVNIPLSEIERFEVAPDRAPEATRAPSASAGAGSAPSGSASTAGAATETPALTLTGIAASVPGTWMHRGHAVFDIQRFLPSGAVSTRSGGRGSWSVEGTELVVKWPTGVVHRYRLEPGATLLSGQAIPLEKKEKPEPISLERMRG